MKIRQDISQRTSPDITIYRVGGNNLVVPITPRSMRRYMLMQDDYIQLEFTLATPVHIAIGDYIVDEIFGTFVIADEQMPRYNQQTGGYDYSLRFDADYMGWRNWLHCLAINKKRVETRWNLTDRLDAQVQQVADNVNIITNPTVHQQTDPMTGITTYTSSGYGIAVTAENAAEIKHLTFEGVNIIEAMNTIAEAWECEWWVTNESVPNGNTTYAHTIHFGKCEEIGEPYEMSLGDNVESMDIARDQQDYCNRLYAYGGTQNIPEDYDRHLEFVATINGSSFYDAGRELEIDMIDAEPTIPTATMRFGAWTKGGTNPVTYTQQSEAVRLSGKQTFSIDLSTMVGISSPTFSQDALPQVMLTAMLYYGDESQIIRVRNYRQGEIIDGVGWFGDIQFSATKDLGTDPVDVYLRLRWSLLFPEGSPHATDSVSHTTSGTAQVYASAANKAVQVVLMGTTYECTFIGATGQITPKPRTMTNGSKYYIANLLLARVPLSWYTIDYDAGTLATVGERRLHLPLLTYPNRYIEASSRTAHQIVERAVIFDGIYPKLILRIKAGTLQGIKKQQRVDHSDGSVSYDDWTQWSFEVEMDKGDGTWGEFPFRDYYILDGNKLQAVFSAPQTTSANGHLLSGMTFDVGISGERYTIIRNDDYGVLLPNERLKPSEGDTLVLTGWNPRYIADLDMVNAAERSLADKANEYLQAVQEGQFTITNKMMSDIMMRYPLCTGNGYDNDNRRMFGLLDPGCMVTVNHDALPGGSKTSRIIGYECKLDMPFDTPSYIVGETEAYSRLKRIERRLTQL